MRLALAAIAMLTGLLGGFAIWQLAAVDAATVAVTEKILPQTRTVGRLSTEIATHRVLEISHILSTDDATMGAIDRKIAELRETIVSDLARLADLVQTPETRRLTDTLANEWDDYLRASDEILALSRRNENAEARQGMDDTERSFLDLAAAADAVVERSRERGMELQGEVNAAMSTMEIVVITLLIIAFAAAIAISIYFDRAVGASISRMTGTMEQLAANDLTVEVAGRDRGDEIGAMARAVQVFKENAERRIALEAEQRAEARRTEARVETLRQLIARFETAVAASLQTFGAETDRLNDTARSLLASADGTASRATSSSSVAQQTSANVQTVASATEEMNSSLQEITHQVVRASGVVNKAVDEARRTNSTVKGLASASDRIGEVVSLIAEIASQTNLLALNATIEAARAGETGKGFAVVAAEVKSLAERTGKATEEISALIGTMQGATGDAVKAIEEIGAIINSINEMTTAISAAVEEQSAATVEISRNVTEAATGTEQVSNNLVELSEASRATGMVATDVQHAAGTLTRSSQQLRGEIDGFLAGIRAA
jgi:methyl-accepting chemotaxis protein